MTESELRNRISELERLLGSNVEVYEATRRVYEANQQLLKSMTFERDGWREEFRRLNELRVSQSDIDTLDRTLEVFTGETHAAIERILTALRSRQ